MDNASTVAIVKAIAKRSAEAARDGLAAGTHEIDITVRIAGTLTVGEDTDKVPTVSIPLKEALALFIRYSGITGPHAVNLLRRALTDALTPKEDGEQNHRGVGAIADAIDIDAEIESIVEPMLATLPRTPVKGAVRPNLRVTEVMELVPA